MNLEKGCQVKLKKKEILEHEREECIYTEKLQCQGCEEMIAVFVLPEHFKDCGYLSYKSVKEIFFKLGTALVNRDFAIVIIVINIYG